MVRVRVGVGVRVRVRVKNFDFLPPIMSVSGSGWR